MFRLAVFPPLSVLEEHHLLRCRHLLSVGTSADRDCSQWQSTTKRASVQQQRDNVSTIKVRLHQWHETGWNASHRLGWQTYRLNNAVACPENCLYCDLSLLCPVCCCILPWGNNALTNSASDTLAYYFRLIPVSLLLKAVKL